MATMQVGREPLPVFTSRLASGVNSANKTEKHQVFQCSLNMHSFETVAAIHFNCANEAALRELKTSSKTVSLNSMSA